MTNPAERTPAWKLAIHALEEGKGDYDTARDELKTAIAWIKKWKSQHEHLQKHASQKPP